MRRWKNFAGATTLGVLLVIGCDTGKHHPPPVATTAPVSSATGPGAATPGSTAAPGAATPGAATPPGVAAAPTSPSQFPLDPTVTQPQNIWHIDFDGLGTIFAQNCIGHGLGVASEALTAPINVRPREAVIARVMRRMMTAYRRSTVDGTGTSGQSLHVTFTSAAPAPALFPGGPGVDYSRICLGSSVSRCSSGTLGVETLDFGNRRAERACVLDRLGSFAGRICGLNSELGQTFRSGPALTLADLRFVDGSYVLGAGSRADDDRFVEIDDVITDWATAIGNVVAHEVGHSVGLQHTAGGIMIGTTNSRDLSDGTLQFSQASLDVLVRNLGVTP